MNIITFVDSDVISILNVKLLLLLLFYYYVIIIIIIMNVILFLIIFASWIFVVKLYMKLYRMIPQECDWSNCICNCNKIKKPNVIRL